MEKENNQTVAPVKSQLPSECTTIIVGEEQSVDGARYLCRSSDRRRWRQNT